MNNVGTSVVTASTDCSNNFTGLQDPTSQDNIVTLPQNKRNPFFTFNQWIFPNLRFGCSRNLSVVTVRVGTSQGQSPPGLFIWEDISDYVINVVSYMRINLTIPNGRTVNSLSNGHFGTWPFVCY